jgi:hypothetical protein
LPAGASRAGVPSTGADACVAVGTRGPTAAPENTLTRPSIASIATIAFFFSRKLLSNRFKWLVISFESNRLYFVNLDASLHNTQDGDAVNIEVGLDFQYITCF